MSPGGDAYAATRLFGHTDLEVIAPDVACDEIGSSQHSWCEAASRSCGYVLVAARNQMAA